VALLRLGAAAGLADVLADEAAEFSDQGVEVRHHLVLFIAVEDLKKVVLSSCVTRDQEGNSTQEDCIGERDVVNDVLFHEIGEQ